MIADEKVMPEKKPILVLAEEKAMSDETRRRRRRSRSPPPPSFFAGYPADGPESGIATAGAHHLIDAIGMKGRRERIVLEPGRVIVGNAGIMLMRVLYVKETPDKTFVITDAGMNDLMRPSLYQAHHDIVPTIRRDGPTMPVDVVGPICES
mgnify:CR=1 FL=1